MTPLPAGRAVLANELDKVEPRSAERTGERCLLVSLGREAQLNLPLWEEIALPRPTPRFLMARRRPPADSPQDTLHHGFRIINPNLVFIVLPGLNLIGRAFRAAVPEDDDHRATSPVLDRPTLHRLHQSSETASCVTPSMPIVHVPPCEACMDRVSTRASGLFSLFKR
jgi:hypothetical protein